MFKSPAVLLQAKSIAIIGASETGAGGWPKKIYQNLEQAGFPAKVYLVNPGRQELWGKEVYPDLRSIPEPVDLALCLIPAAAIPDALREGVECGLKAGLIFASRFGEEGTAEGAARAQAVKILCTQTGLRVMGPNCMGAISTRQALRIYPSPRVRDLANGPVGVVFQSGGTFMFWLQQAAVRGLGFSYAISSGNELDLDLSDYIKFLVDDPDTKVIVCLVEGIRRPHAFAEAARQALLLGKPIVLVKVGRSERGKAAAKSHTGALAGDDRIFDAVCHKFGVLRAHSLDDMIEITLALMAARLPKGPAVAMSGFSGGAKGLLLDYAAEAGLQIAAISLGTATQLRDLIDPGVPAENPLDIGAGVASQPQKFTDICKILVDDPNVDLIAIQASLPATEDEIFDPTPYAKLVQSTTKPVLAYGRMSQNMTKQAIALQKAAGIPFLQGLPETTRVIRHLINYAKATVSSLPQHEYQAANASSLQAGEIEKTLANYGIPAPSQMFANDLNTVSVAAEQIGFPVALKIVSPQASHKTEVGGVQLNLTSSQSVAAAAAQMQVRLKAIDPDALVEGFLIQEMVKGLEMIVGVRSDPQYGPYLVVGLGGIYVEALNDTAVCMLPMTRERADEMLASLKCSPILGEYRGEAARDREALIDAMLALSKLFLDHQTWLSEIEINPITVLTNGKGVRAIDIRAVLI